MRRDAVPACCIVFLYTRAQTDIIRHMLASIIRELLWACWLRQKSVALPHRPQAKASFLGIVISSVQLLFTKPPGLTASHTQSSESNGGSLCRSNKPLGNTTIPEQGHLVPTCCAQQTFSCMQHCSITCQYKHNLIAKKNIYSAMQ